MTSPVPVARIVGLRWMIEDFMLSANSKVAFIIMNGCFKVKLSHSDIAELIRYYWRRRLASGLQFVLCSDKLTIEKKDLSSCLKVTDHKMRSA